MRLLLPILLLAGCSAETPPEQAVYAGAGRDRLCINGERAGFIAYGNGDMNCSARGRVERAGEHLFTLVPAGDQDCRIAAEKQGTTVRLGKASAACSYYCGPGADYSGKAFTRAAAAAPAVDFAGDPLC